MDSAGFFCLGGGATSLSIDRSAGDGGEAGSPRLGDEAEESVALFTRSVCENGERCGAASTSPMPGALDEGATAAAAAAVGPPSEAASALMSGAD